MKSSFYLKHDLDAREDDKMRSLLMKFGVRGYGIYWCIAEDIYRENGRLARDYSALSWSYREPVKDIKSVVENFGLFYDSNGKIASRRVDRAIAERKEASEQARQAGKASAAKRASNGRSTVAEPGEERTGQEGEDQDKTSAPSAVDLSKETKDAVKAVADRRAQALEEIKLLDLKMPFGPKKGIPIVDLEPSYCEWALREWPHMGKDLIRALRLRVKIRAEETAR